MSYISAGNTTTTTLIQGGDTTGNLVFATGGANTAALTINNAQNLQLNAAAGKLLNSSGNPILQQTGSIIQVVSSSLTNAFSTTSNTLVSSGIGLSITPTSSTSKILVRMTVSVVSGSSGCGISIYRDSTPVFSPATADSSGSYGTLNAGAAAAWAMLPIEYLDSPATTSSVSYNLYVASRLAATTYINQAGANNSGKTVITLMEIAA